LELVAKESFIRQLGMVRFPTLRYNNKRLPNLVQPLHFAPDKRVAVKMGTDISIIQEHIILGYVSPSISKIMRFEFRGSRIILGG
jgi:hypothetical protein